METSGVLILLIDDDPFFRRVLGDAFKESGFSIITAENGQEGVRLFREHRPAAVLCDLVMPGMGGVSTCQAIAVEAAPEEPVMVLLTSMFKEPPHEHPTAEMGARVHIPKFCNPVDIVILVEQLLARERYRTDNAS